VQIEDNYPVADFARAFRNRFAADVNGPLEHPHERTAPFSWLDSAGTDFGHGRKRTAGYRGSGPLGFALPV
jgi:hypothetical protein